VSEWVSSFLTAHQHIIGYFSALQWCDWTTLPVLHKLQLYTSEISTASLVCLLLPPGVNISAHQFVLNLVSHYISTSKHLDDCSQDCINWHVKKHTVAVRSPSMPVAIRLNLILAQTFLSYHIIIWQKSVWSLQDMTISCQITDMSHIESVVTKQDAEDHIPHRFEGGWVSE